MIVIIEGPDGAGKSELATKIAEEFRMEVRHEGPPPTDIKLHLYYGRKLKAAKTQDRYSLGQGTVFDRLYLGETVYGPVLRGIDRLGPSSLKLMERLAASCNVFKVMCLPGYEVARRNWASGRPELFDSDAKFRATYDGFSRISDGNYIYDYTKDPHCEYLFQRMKAHRFRSLPEWMIGSPNAKFLFIGERGSQKQEAYVDLPFWGVDNSSQYLNDALANIFKEEEIAFMNAYDMYGEPNTLLTSNAYGYPWRIIALGKAAAKFCEKQNVKYSEVPHPQFWRRFHHLSHGKAGYSQLILNRITDAHSSPLPR